MKKFLLNVIFLLASAKTMQSQCTVNIATSATIGCAPFQVMFTCPAINSGTLNWMAGSYTATGTSASFTFSTLGDYSVSLTASIISSPTQSFTATATLAIRVVTGPDNGCSSTISSIEETSEIPYLDIYPNPCTEIFGIKTEYDLTHAVYSIYTASGKKIMESRFLPGQTYVNVSGLSKGFYTLYLFKEGKCLSRKKLLIE